MADVGPGKNAGSGRNPVDVYVGSRLRLRRTVIGMSQERLGQAVGLTFQQIQKYEKGANRIGASRMYAFARVLEVAPGWFFEGIEAHFGHAPPAKGFREEDVPFADPPEKNVAASREALELMRAYARVRDPGVRKGLFELIKAVADRDMPASA